MTVSMWPTLAQHEVYVSDLVLAEIQETPSAERREAMLSLLRGFPSLDTRQSNVSELATDYLALGALPRHAGADALHVAVAVVNGLDVVLSWNMRHLVKLRTRRAVNGVNAVRGFPPIEILTPPEL